MKVLQVMVISTLFIKLYAQEEDIDSRADLAKRQADTNSTMFDLDFETNEDSPPSGEQGLLGLSPLLIRVIYQAVIGQFGLDGLNVDNIKKFKNSFSPANVRSDLLLFRRFLNWGMRLATFFNRLLPQEMHDNEGFFAYFRKLFPKLSILAPGILNSGASTITAPGSSAIFSTASPTTTVANFILQAQTEATDKTIEASSMAAAPTSTTTEAIIIQNEAITSGPAPNPLSTINSHPLTGPQTSHEMLMLRRDKSGVPPPDNEHNFSELPHFERLLHFADQNQLYEAIEDYDDYKYTRKGDLSHSYHEFGDEPLEDEDDGMSAYSGHPSRNSYGHMLH